MKNIQLWSRKTDKKLIKVLIYSLILLFTTILIFFLPGIIIVYKQSSVIKYCAESSGFSVVAKVYDSRNDCSVAKPCIAMDDYLSFHPATEKYGECLKGFFGNKYYHFAWPTSQKLNFSYKSIYEYSKNFWVNININN